MPCYDNLPRRFPSCILSTRVLVRPETQSPARSSALTWPPYQNFTIPTWCEKRARFLSPGWSLGAQGRSVWKIRSQGNWTRDREGSGRFWGNLTKVTISSGVPVSGMGFLCARPLPVPFSFRFISVLPRSVETYGWFARPGKAAAAGTAVG